MKAGSDWRPVSQPSTKQTAWVASELIYIYICNIFWDMWNSKIDINMLRLFLFSRYWIFRFWRKWWQNVTNKQQERGWILQHMPSLWPTWCVPNTKYLSLSPSVFIHFPNEIAIFGGKYHIFKPQPHPKPSSKGPNQPWGTARVSWCTPPSSKAQGPQSCEPP